MRVAEKVVQVPEMAESISEGTLKQWSKRWFAGFIHIDGDCTLSSCIEIGDYVEQDEEIATIETDKVRDFPEDSFQVC